MNIEQAVPTKLVKVRPMRDEDAAHLMQWLKQGHCKELFHSKSLPTYSSVLEYQKNIQQPDCIYQCMIVEDDRHPIGYFDYRYRNHFGQILGIYIEPRLRSKRIGKHLLRWAIANLRNRGCHEVQVEVHFDNPFSLNIFRTIGFHIERVQNQIEGSKPVHVLRRSISPFQRLGPPEPAYAFLSGENLYLHHVAIAEALVDQIKHLQEVEVILGLGSLGRGFGDQWSDLDIAVIRRGTDLKNLWRGERRLAEVDVDLFVIDLDTDPPSTWDDSRLQAFEESIILFARDASVVHQLRQAVHLSNDERIRKIQEIILKLGWIGFQPREWYDKTKYGYIWSVPQDLWLRRGSVASAHTTVDRVLDDTLQLLFLVNGRRIPDVKWRRYLAPHLPWLPPNFNTLITQVEEEKRNAEGFRSRAEAVVSIVEGIVKRLEDTGEISGDIYQSYLQSTTDY